MTNKEVGKKLKELRLAKGLTAYKLSKITGLSEQQIGQVEKNGPKTDYVLRKYLNAVDGQLIIKGI